MGWWNSYLAPLIFISTTAKQLIGPGTTMFVKQYSQNYGGLQMAGASSALLPILIVYLLAQRYFIEGLAMTGIKGYAGFIISRGY